MENEKLVLRHSWGDESASGVCEIPFEYESKEQFVYDILEKYKNHKWEYYNTRKSDYDTSKVEIFGMWLSKGELEDIEHNVFTLQEWFHAHKLKVDFL